MAGNGNSHMHLTLGSRKAASKRGGGVERERQVGLNLQAMGTLGQYCSIYDISLWRTLHSL
jgi:hypothetical protein